MARKTSTPPRTSKAASSGSLTMLDPIAPLVIAAAATLACSPIGGFLWSDGILQTNVLRDGPGSLKFYPGQLEPLLSPSLPYLNLALLGYCCVISGKVKGAMPGAPWLQSLVATALVAFGGGTIVPLLLGVPVVWLRASDLFLSHCIAAWLLSHLLIYETTTFAQMIPARLLTVLFQAFRAAVVFAMRGFALGKSNNVVPGGIGSVGLLVCMTLGGCGGLFMPLSKGLDALKEGAPQLMTSAATAAFSFLLVEAALANEATKDLLPLGEMCSEPTKFAQLGQFLCVVWFVSPLLPKLS